MMRGALSNDKTHFDSILLILWLPIARVVSSDSATVEAPASGFVLFRPKGRVVASCPLLSVLSVGFWPPLFLLSVAVAMGFCWPCVVCFTVLVSTLVLLMVV